MSRHWLAIGGSSLGALALLALILATDTTNPTVQPALHAVLIGIAVLISTGLAALNIRTFTVSGKIQHLALSTAFLLFSAVYVWHGVFTSTGHPFAFLIYGPASRFAFGAALIGFASKETVPTRLRIPYLIGAIGGAALVAILGFLMHGPIDAWAQGTSMERLQATRISVETVAIALIMVGFIRILRSSDPPPHLPLVATALTLLIMQSVYFLATSAWSITWWAAHAVGATSTTLLAGTVWVNHQRAEASREQERFRELNALKTEFINIAAHELSTPLTPIRLQIDVLTTKGQALTEEQARSIALIDRNVQRIENLVERIQEGSKSLTGKRETDIRSFDLAAMIKDLCDSYRPISERASGTLDLEGPPTLMVRSDPRRIEQVVTNLLNNAVKYTSEGNRIQVTLDADDQRATIVVSDDGIGMPPDLLERLFQPFSQGNNPDRPITGSGLGLFLSRQDVDLLGGTIRATSPGRGKGSTFRVTIPRDLEAVPKRAST